MPTPLKMKRIPRRLQAASSSACLLVNELESQVSETTTTSFTTFWQSMRCFLTLCITLSKEKGLRDPRPFVTARRVEVQVDVLSEGIRLMWVPPSPLTRSNRSRNAPDSIASIKSSKLPCSKMELRRLETALTSSGMSAYSGCSSMPPRGSRRFE